MSASASASIRSESCVEPTRSQNMAVSCRSSASMLDDPGRFARAVVATPGGAAAPGSAAEGASADDVAPALAPAGGVGAPRGVAHFPQNAASGGFSPPQRLQVRASGVAQLTQKLI